MEKFRVHMACKVLALFFLVKMSVDTVGFGSIAENGEVLKRFISHRIYAATFKNQWQVHMSILIPFLG